MAFIDTLGAIGTGLSGASGVANSVLGFMNYDYQKKMQQQAWSREDNAVQRKAFDLESAGLSKTLAAGSSASTMAPISLSAPKVDTQVIETALKNLQMRKDFEQADAQIALANAQKQGVDIENEQKAYDYQKIRDAGMLKNAPSGFAGQVAQGLSMLGSAIPMIKDWTSRSKWFTFLNHDSGSSKKVTTFDYLSGKANNLTGGVASSHAVGEDSKPVYDFWRQNANERAQEYYLEQGKRGSFGNRYR